MIKLMNKIESFGWGAKIGSADLKNILKNLFFFKDKNVLIFEDKFDDAGVYKINSNLALIQTVDFLPPMVNDPFSFGKIAVANALSDIYAMGGIPKTALNVALFPIGKISIFVLQNILKGAIIKLKEANVSLLGGHTLNDNELKFGMSVTGFINPKKIWSNIGAKKGDVLILTKKLGTSIISHAIKKKLTNKKEIKDASNSMEKLNKKAVEIAKTIKGIHACTDITGFGLVGHLLEMINENKLISFNIWFEKLKFLKGVLKYAKLNFASNLMEKNKKSFEKYVSFKKYKKINTKILKNLIFSPETSGGLIFSFDKKRAKKFLNKMEKINEIVFVIGEVIEKKTKKIYIK